MAEGRIHVADLINDPELHMTLIAGRQGIQRDVRSMHIAYHKDVLTRIAPNTFCLTMDQEPLSLMRDGVEFVRRLDELDMAGLGIGLFHSSRPVPPDMLAEADRLGFPVATVSSEIPFQVLMERASQRLIALNVYELKRVLAAQESLLEVDDEETARGILARLSTILEASFLLLNDRGELLLASGHRIAGVSDPAFVREVWQAYLGMRGEESINPPLPTSRGPILLKEIRVRGVLRQILVAVGLGSAHLETFGDSVLAFALRLLQLELLSHARTGASISEGRQRVFAALMSASSPAGDERQLIDVGFADPHRLRVLAVRLTGPSAGLAMRTQALTEAIRHLETRRWAFVAGLVADHIVIVVQASDDAAAAGVDEGRQLASALLRFLSAECHGARADIGVSFVCSELSAVVHSVADAMLAASRGESTADGTTVHCEDLGLEIRLVHALPTVELRSLDADVFGGLESVETEEAARYLSLLQTYVANDCSVAETAAELYMHRNTVRRRIERLQALTGLDFALLSDLTKVRIAFSARELLACRDRLL